MKPLFSEVTTYPVNHPIHKNSLATFMSPQTPHKSHESTTALSPTTVFLASFLFLANLLVDLGPFADLLFSLGRTLKKQQHFLHQGRQHQLSLHQQYISTNSTLFIRDINTSTLYIRDINNSSLSIRDTTAFSPSGTSTTAISP
ncbi:hypothetical protein PoB_005862600 [Plakobranchus ocellatus]|uniref:Uncharacterized protein n=1 Tax=Plakobranchus ocellatus TaxID=259542 RepID=A0AAV4CH20_9GAST|nr:hypothetical protein PoB_005862600 [Plakobranchus ocellatus]